MSPPTPPVSLLDAEERSSSPSRSSLHMPNSKNGHATCGNGGNSTSSWRSCQDLGGISDVGGMDMEGEVKEAYKIMKRIEVLDVSVEGSLIFAAAEHASNIHEHVVLAPD
jgi:hypothetical protein